MTPPTTMSCRAALRARLLPMLLRELPVCSCAHSLQPATMLRPAWPTRAAAAGGATARASIVRRAATSSTSSSSDSEEASQRKKLVFCGTPDVAARVLERLLAAAAQPDASFHVAGVVTQRPRPTGRGNRKVPQPSPVQLLAEQAGLPASAILAPERPGDPAFLDALRALGPHLCVTAAYGNYLPSSFLGIPPYGTLNIHPSLLPRYRGAAPVQRALQDGVPVTGVSVLYTVRAMDAGPILAQQELEVDPDIQAPELLHRLFELGTDLLVASLPLVWAGKGPQAAHTQDESAASHAAKLSRDEAVLDFSQAAAACHNQVRGFAGWPATFATFQQRGPDGGDLGPLELKVVRTALGSPAEWSGASERQVAAARDALLIRCGDGSVLKVLEVQAPGKRVVAARDFVNGLKGRTLLWQAVEQPVGAAA